MLAAKPDPSAARWAQMGGCAYVNDTGQLTLREVLVGNCSSDGFGGGVGATGNGSVAAFDSVFGSNSAVSGGADLHLVDGVLTLVDTVFSDVMGNPTGGGVFNGACDTAAVAGSACSGVALAGSWSETCCFTRRNLPC